MSLPRLWAFLAVALPVLGGFIAYLNTPDLTYQLRAGAEILATGRIPQEDSWTYTAAGMPWVDQQWGAQVILAAVFDLGGWTGLVILRAVVVAVTFGALFATARVIGAPMRTASWLCLAAFIVSAGALGIRPQLFGLALFAVVLLLVADRRNHPARLWGIPILAIVWASVHGSFIFAPLVLGLAWLEDLADGVRRKHLALAVAIAATAATILNPYGPAIWTYALGLSTNQAVNQLVTEWQPTVLRSVSGILFYGSALAVGALFARRPTTIPWPTLVWTATFFAIGAFAVRGTVWWALAIVVPVAVVLAARSTATAPLEDRGRSQTDAPEPARLRRLNAGIAVAVVAAWIALLPAWRPIDPGLQAPERTLGFAPSGITGALREIAVPGDRVFNPQRWGSWFEFAIPEARYAVDSRFEIYPAEVWTDYGRIVSGDAGWMEVVERWDVTIAVTDGPGEEDLAGRLRAAGWIERYRDDEGFILVRPDRG